MNMCVEHSTVPLAEPLEILRKRQINATTLPAKTIEERTSKALNTTSQRESSMPTNGAAGVRLYLRWELFQNLPMDSIRSSMSRIRAARSASPDRLPPCPAATVPTGPRRSKRGLDRAAGGGDGRP